MSDTRISLLEAAADLFFEKGIENTSVREIVVRAGQSNASALHYHFGSRKGLLAALIPYGAQLIDAVRGRLMDELETSGRDDDVEALIHVHAFPLVECATKDPSSIRHMSILIQILGSPTFDINEILFLVSPPHAQRVIRRLIDTLEDLPKPVIQFRLSMLRGLYGSLAQNIIENHKYGSIEDIESILPLHTHYVAHATQIMLADIPAGAYPNMQYLSDALLTGGQVA